MPVYGTCYTYAFPLTFSLVYGYSTRNVPLGVSEREKIRKKGKM